MRHTHSLRRNPESPFIDVERPGSLSGASATSVETRSAAPYKRSDRVFRSLLLYQIGACILTGGAGADLEACHILKTIRRDPDRKAKTVSNQTVNSDKAQHVDAQQKALGALVLVLTSEPLFKLDDVYNGILLEGSLHTHWDYYGNFLILPQLSDLHKLLDALKESNTEWQQQADAFGSGPRPLDPRLPTFTSTLWTVVVVHPDAFLPRGKPILLYQSSTEEWRSYTVRSHALHEANAPHTVLTPFPSSHGFSTLALCMNAHEKFEYHVELGVDFSSFSEEHQESKRILKAIYTEIYFVPVPVPGTAGATIDAAAAEREAISQSLNARTRQDCSRFKSAENEGKQESRSHGTTEANREYGDMESDSEEAPSSPEEMDYDGMTKTEFDIVWERYNAPGIDKTERARLGSMIIFGVDRRDNLKSYSAI